jgi:hypothetical protein
MTFAAYLTRRGYDAARPSLRRMFVEVWAAPSFREFWRVWNPVYGFVLFRLYVALGASRGAAMAVFVLCGWGLHDLPMSLAIGRTSVVSTVAFAWYGLLVLTERPAPRSDAVNVVLNVARVLSGLALGAGVEIARATS